MQIELNMPIITKEMTTFSCSYNFWETNSNIWLLPMVLLKPVQFSSLTKHRSQRTMTAAQTLQVLHVHLTLSWSPRIQMWKNPGWM